ncbi:MAG: bifunctional adenosylcobinamide kinase/adenosylcobinamide-phosphate guanylyltransferase [Firmicutes bacterium]|nr:bifunctional adenosylcobinamide kinase/adenosylcobinamide-phosphate guanylyltransferase [Bacillota bacterium]
MGKLILISGENDSGKSLAAEKIAVKIEGRRYYIATMIPKIEDNYIRIEKHRKRRETLDFTTLELPYSVADAPVEPGGVVLIEDISNLLANNIFEKNNTMENVFYDIKKLVEKCRIVIAVTISGLKSDGYDGETANYIDNLNELNARLAQTACVVIKMSDGNMIYEKVEDDVYKIPYGGNINI